MTTPANTDFLKEMIKARQANIVVELPCRFEAEIEKVKELIASHYHNGGKEVFVVIKVVSLMYFSFPRWFFNEADHDEIVYITLSQERVAEVLDIFHRSGTVGQEMERYARAITHLGFQLGVGMTKGSMTSSLIVFAVMPEEVN